jgi:twinkle protein
MATANEIASKLKQRAEEVAKYLLPNGKRVGNEWLVGSIAGNPGESLKICLAGDKVGVFCDFATGDKGDLLTLWHLKRNSSLLEAIKEAKGWLGIATPSFVAYKPKNYAKPNPITTTSLAPASPVRQYLMSDRKLMPETLAAFKIGEMSNEIVFPYYRNGELVNVKYLSLERPNGKKKIRAEANCEPCLFGWHTLSPGAREVTLTEGEIDTLSLHQYGIPALSVPFGGGKGAKQQWVEHEYDRLAAFDKIYLCFDNDAEGQAAIEELIGRLGRHRCFVVQLPHKDANACLMAGMSQEEMQACFAQAKSLDPVELKSAALFVDKVIDEFYPGDDQEKGIHPPWEKARGKVLFRPDELSIWTGTNGHGKSQLLGQIILSTMKEGACVCVASLELKPKRLLMRLTRQAGGLSNPTEGYIRAIHDWYNDRLWIFDLVGNAKSDRLLDVFRYARQRYGITTFVIDSFMKLDIAEDDYKAQKAFLEKLCDFKNEHNCHVHLVVHPRKGADESKLPGKLDTKGTGAITDLADNCFVVWRNKAKEAAVQSLLAQGKQPDENLKNQCDAIWICDKQRNGEWEGKIGLWFHAASFQYLNHQTQKPFQFVSYSCKDNII